ncbi:MAG: 3-oxoacyl-[acyl-carrier-protein] reductase FabG [Eubacteriales bacterium SKADARSKE-1]|nr:3-oxoacyl-[acyl-carrier-protein] reductase FabG [Eubacteriales bacterium SKADARSKE-1]
MFSLKNKVAVVTGASRGIGQAIAIKMAESGADIALIYAKNEKKANKVKSTIINMGQKAITYQCDVSDFDESKMLIYKIMQDFQTIDILVNNAGIVKDNLLFSMTNEDFNEVIKVNLNGTFNMIHHTYLNFVKKKNGRIINISSILGVCGSKGGANYAASKAGIIGLSKSVAKELAAFGVTCNVIAPGYIRTDMTNGLSDSSKEIFAKEIPLKKFGDADDIAAAAVFLASEESKYVTGEVLKVDGGLLM